MMKRGAFQSGYLIFGFLLFLAHCTGISGTSGLGDSLSGDSTSGTTESGDSTGSSGSSEESGSSGSAGEGEALPSFGFPAPALRTDSEKIVIALSATDTGESTTARFGWGIARAWAESTSSTHVAIIGYDSSVDTSTLADADGNGYVDDVKMIAATGSLETSCEITYPAGSFTCYLSGATNTDTINVYAIDSTGESTSDTYSDLPSTSFAFFAQDPQDVAVAETISGTDAQIPLWILGDGVGLGFVDSADVLSIYGDYAELYSQGSLSGTQLAYASTSAYNYFGLLDNSDATQPGIDLYSFDGSTPTYRCTWTGENTETFNFVKKTTDGELRVGRKALTPESDAYFFHALDKTDCDPDPTQDDKIQFLATGDISGVMVKSLIAADVDDTYGTAIVVFEDDSGNIRIRMAADPSLSLGATGREGGATALSGTYDLRDLVIYKSQSGDVASSDKGKFLIPDYTNNVVWVGKYFLDRTLPYTEHDITDSLSNSVTVGTGPQGITLNTEKTIAYVLNSDNTISAFPLKDSSGNLLTAKQMNTRVTTITLSDYLSGKDLNFTADGLAYYETNNSSQRKLVIGTVGLKGGLIVDVTSYEASALPSAVDLGGGSRISPLGR